jgi:hypothetical protein
MNTCKLNNYMPVPVYRDAKNSPFTGIDIHRISRYFALK